MNGRIIGVIIRRVFAVIAAIIAAIFPYVIESCKHDSNQNQTESSFTPDNRQTPNRNIQPNTNSYKPVKPASELPVVVAKPEKHSSESPIIVVINNLSDGFEVKKETVLTGTASIPSGHYLWVLVRRSDFSPLWWPQREARVNPETQR